MRTFLSWSGDASRRLAEGFKQWAPQVLQFLDEPFISSRDIYAGERWGRELSEELEDHTFGIAFVTREAIASPWIMFEAGALSKISDDSRYIAILCDIELHEVSHTPLAQFQNQPLTFDGMQAVLESICVVAQQQRVKVGLPDTMRRWRPDIQAWIEEFRLEDSESLEQDIDVGALISDVLSRIQSIEQKQDLVSATLNQVHLNTIGSAYSPLGFGALTEPGTPRGIGNFLATGGRGIGKTGTIRGILDQLDQMKSEADQISDDENDDDGAS